MTSTPQEIESINQVLSLYPDKEWNYSRIVLELRHLETIDSPYVLVTDSVDLRQPEGKKRFANYEREITWGTRHSSELGILELISLRLNKALLESMSTDVRPVLRIEKKEELIKQGITTALWYRVIEVTGEEFDNR